MISISRFILTSHVYSISVLDRKVGWFSYVFFSVVFYLYRTFLPFQEQSRFIFILINNIDTLIGPSVRDCGAHSNLSNYISLMPNGKEFQSWCIKANSGCMQTYRPKTLSSHDPLGIVANLEHSKCGRFFVSYLH